MWLETVPECDFKGFRSGEGTPVEEEDGIIEEKFAMLGCDMGLEVVIKDINELIAELADELTTDELVALQKEQEEERST